MCKELSPWEKAVDFHGHACPGLAIGYKVAETAVQQMGHQRDIDEEIIAVVENASCAVDAIQSVLGCTAGKGNMVFRQNGKHVYTIGSRNTGKAVRIALKFGVLEGFQGSKEEKTQQILNSNPSDLFTIQNVEDSLPPKAIIYKTVQCSACGEGVMEPMAHLRNGLVVCPDCFHFDR